MVLPLASQFLHTCHFKIHSGGYNQQEPSELVKQFGSIIWELLNILRENFPSKVRITQEGIERCAPYYVPMQQSEEVRRMLSCILSIKEEMRMLTRDELEDVVWTMDFAQKIKDNRSLSACLDLINGDRVDRDDFTVCVVDQESCMDTLRAIVQSADDPLQIQSNIRLATVIHNKA